MARDVEERSGQESLTLKHMKLEIAMQDYDEIHHEHSLNHFTLLRCYYFLYHGFYIHESCVSALKLFFSSKLLKMSSKI